MAEAAGRKRRYVGLFGAARAVEREPARAAPMPAIDHRAIRNVIAHVQAHNRIVECDLMWDAHRTSHRTAAWLGDGARSGADDDASSGVLAHAPDERARHEAARRVAAAQRALGPPWSSGAEARAGARAIGTDARGTGGHERPPAAEKRRSHGSKRKSAHRSRRRSAASDGSSDESSARQRRARRNARATGTGDESGCGLRSA
ncbi:hypothetical protein KFE25_013750 [Diacronema lutheri]|uniref:Uncharacterized protein n=1 Tax=Diacronema lutheri TaxID=2081491 RepID=A0A8J6CBF5_DIALT|nr:hypothetical protein KFE25_013750 [Diacronema lutheri]